MQTFHLVNISLKGFNEMEILFGFFIGIIVSYTAWWINSHWIKSDVCFSTEVARIRLKEGHRLYQVAFENCGRRKIVDVEIMVRVGVKGFQGIPGWRYHSIRSNVSKIPYLDTGEKNRRIVRVFDTRQPLQFVDLPSSSFQEAILSCKTLEEILRLGREAIVQVHVFSFDAFSGNRKNFASKNYRKNHIKTGKFKGLLVIPEKENLSIVTPNLSDSVYVADTTIS